MRKFVSRLIPVAGLALVFLALPGSVQAIPLEGDDGRVIMPADQPDRGLVYRGMRPGGDTACRGMYRLDSGGCTHGPDAPPPGRNVKKPVPPVTQTSSLAAAAVCDGDGTSGNRVQLIYIHPAGTDRYAQYLASFRQWANDMDVIYNESAKETGGSRRIRYVHDANCVPTVLNVQVSSAALASFSTTISELKSKGYNRTDREYSVLGDATTYCGIGEFRNDDRKVSTNRSNYGPVFARSDRGCWSGHTMAHELGHNLGAVAYSAPNTSGGAHCTDEYDVMCYSDSPNYPPMRYICTNSGQENRLDCGHNDYYHTNPPAGNYLATHWNMADSVFLINPGGTPPPTRTGPITGAGSNRCVDIPNANPADGTQLQLFDCNGTSGQTWTFGTDGTVKAMGKCLDVRGGSSADATPVQINTCNGSTAQRWTYDASTRQLKALGKCLDAFGGGSANGTKLIIWTCHTGTNQKWAIPS